MDEAHDIQRNNVWELLLAVTISFTWGHSSGTVRSLLRPRRGRSPVQISLHADTCCMQGVTQPSLLLSTAAWQLNHLTKALSGEVDTNYTRLCMQDTPNILVPRGWHETLSHEYDHKVLL